MISISWWSNFGRTSPPGGERFNETLIMGDRKQDWNSGFHSHSQYAHIEGFWVSYSEHFNVVRNGDDSIM